MWDTTGNGATARWGFNGDLFPFHKPIRFHCNTSSPCAPLSYTWVVVCLLDQAVGAHTLPTHLMWLTLRIVVVTMSRLSAMSTLHALLALICSFRHHHLWPGIFVGHQPDSQSIELISHSAGKRFRKRGAVVRQITKWVTFEIEVDLQVRQLSCWLLA